VTVEFDLSASASLTAPTVSILLPVLSENEMKQRIITAEIERNES
jgi:hypothetical protein